MQAIILATSETDKLRPLTQAIPSAMLPVMNRPVMVYAVELLARQGFKHIFVSLHHLAGGIESYFGSGQRWNVSLTYLLQKEAWGTAGALKWAETHLKETFIVLPAETLIDLDIRAALAQHQARKSVATVVVHRSGRGGRVFLGAKGQVTGVEDAPAGGHPYTDTGVYIFAPEVLRRIPKRTPFDIHRQLLPALIRAGLPVHGHQIESPPCSLETFRDFQEAQWLLAQPDGKRGAHFLGASVRQVAPGIWVDRNTLIHPNARLTPPVFVGQNCFIGQDVELGPRAMIGSHVIVDDGATVSNSTILDNTYVGRLVNIQHYVVQKGWVCDVQKAECTQIVDRFLLGEAQTIGAENRLQKLFNSLAALVLLLVSLPVTVPLGLVVLLTSGRLFNRIERIGTPKKPDDNMPRITLLRFATRTPHGAHLPVGKWLERLELHRLPELWNVVRGELGLVGVKPLTPAEAEKVVEQWQKKRNEYRVGFTGLWYVQRSNKHDLDDLLVTDAYYVATRNWKQDVKLLLQTPLAWLSSARQQ